VEELMKMRQQTAGLRTSQVDQGSARQEPAEGEASYRLLAELSSDGVLVHREGLILFANPAAARLLGAASPQELIGQPVMDFMHPEHREMVEDRPSRVLQKGQPVGFVEQKVIRLDGEVAHVAASWAPITFEGEPAIQVVARDITGRKQAEEALRQRNQELELFSRASASFTATLDLDQVLITTLEEVRHLLHVVAASIWLVDPATGELVCRHATGQKGDLVRGWRLAPRQGLAGWVAEHGQSLVVADAWTDERYFRQVDRKTGLEIRSLLTVPLLIKGKAIGVIQVLDSEIGRFTSEDLKLMEALAVSAAIAVENARLYQEADRLRAFNENIIQSMEEGILIQDSAGHISFVNPSAAHLLEYAPDELIGRPWKTAVAPEQLIQIGPALERRGQSVTSRYETVLLTKTGRRVPVIISDSSLSEDGQYAGVISVFTDITDWKRAEDALYQRNRELSMLNQIMAASASGLKPEAILETACRELAIAFDVPQAAVALLNHNQSEAVVMAEYLAPDRVSMLQAVIPLKDSPSAQRLLNTKAPLVAEDAPNDPNLAFIHDLLRKTAITALLFLPLRAETELIGGLMLDMVDPARFSVDDISLAWSVAGQLGAVLAQVNLNAQRRQLEQQYHQAQKMEAVGRLTAGIAHDFNNLLTAINGFTQLMRFDLPPEDPRDEMLEKILASGRRAADLIRQLLVFSRKQVVDLQVFDLNDVVPEMDKMLRRIIGEDIELRAALGRDLWLVKADPAQIEQIIVNLAVNARDAMPEGGRLTIETANVVLDEGYTATHLHTQPGEHVLLSVSDTGVGMSEEVQARIFEPFFTTKEAGKGTGLGLATVFSIVKQAGGSIWVYSEENVGSTFKIYLPRTHEEVYVAAPPRAPADLPGGDETILLVEDDSGVRELTRRVLTGRGYSVLEAQDGQEAMLVSTHHPGPIHLLLTDVIMPGISGRALASRLARARPDLRVLFMSGYSDEAIVHHGVLEEGVAFLQKPFSAAALTGKVRQVLDVGRASES
jgi:PAS domain S-box-containing protein